MLIHLVYRFSACYAAHCCVVTAAVAFTAFRATLWLWGPSGRREALAQTPFWQVSLSRQLQQRVALHSISNSHLIACSCNRREFSVHLRNDCPTVPTVLSDFGVTVPVVLASHHLFSRFGRHFISPNCPVPVSFVACCCLFCATGHFSRCVRCCPLTVSFRLQFGGACISWRDLRASHFPWVVWFPVSGGCFRLFSLVFGSGVGVPRLMARR